ncbi:hypothetical protein L1049_013789 [Liquidambar formosana]|uniref:Enhanced disease resistance 4-like N-terminal domain-containing protein n=1 Tax=Liquidambar formosana TaxID=63359 RepID=A0AAP0WUD0_LIQFO
MADLAKFRVVRCPKCECLLPERADYSIYQCGGCGALLRAKKRNRKAVSFSEKPVEERVERVSAGLGNASMRTEYEELKPQVGNASGSQRSERISEHWRFGERGNMKGSRRIPETHVEGVRFSTSNYSDEAPSKYFSDTSYSYRDSQKNSYPLDESNRDEYLEHRAELLRKIDELKDLLSLNVVEKPKEKAPLDRRVVHQESFGGSDTWFRNGSSGSNRGLMQSFVHDKHVTGAPYYSHYPEPHPFMSRHEMAEHCVNPSMHTSNHVPASNNCLMQSFVLDKHIATPPHYRHYPEQHSFVRYRDPVRTQMLRRSPNQAPDKKGISEVDTLSEKSDEERVGGFSVKLNSFSKKGMSENLENLFGKGIASVSDASDMDVKSNSSSSTNKQRKDSLSKVTASKRAVRSASMSRRRISDLQIEESGEGEMEGFRRKLKIDTRSVGFSTANSSDEGRSYYDSDTSYGESLKNRSDHESNRDEYLEQDRAEILRKLDELKDQLSRIDTKSVGFSTANSSDEGRSYYDSDTSYGESLKNRSDHESNGDEYLEQDRAEILRKLAELKDRLGRMNGGRKEKPKQLTTGFYSSLFRIGSWRKL